MTDFAIKVQNLHKLYHLDNLQSRTFTESLHDYAKSFFQKGENNDTSREFWALKDISFELKKGECLGIFGRNGAGKSTLMKILGEITQPTIGEVEINGKIASVFEVGLGFHQDLSGKDNLFLSGSLLGMSRKEIADKLDDIISFSGIGSFINAPVKHYSSGMNVRLAFTFVTHISADILLFDEVLSVGDAEFKLKTSKRIKEMVGKGKTIILVTHNLSEILDICDKALVLEHGEIKALGDPLDLISDYAEEAHNLALSSNVTTISSNRDSPKKKIQNFKIWEKIEDAPGNETARIQKITVRGKGKELSDKVYMEDAIEVEICYQKLLPNDTIDVGFTLHDSTGMGVFAATTGLSLSAGSINANEEGIYTAVCEIPANYLNKGTFTLNVFVVKNKTEVVHTSLSDITLLKVHYNKCEIQEPLADRFPGPLRPLLKWEISKMEGTSKIFP